MRILVVTQYFWPESFLINRLVVNLARAGHEVTVYTGKPNYPKGEIFDGYGAAGTQREVYEGCVDVYRVPLRPRGDGGAWNLIRNYASFVFSGLRYFGRFAQDKEFDLILVYAPSPITAAIPAIRLKHKCRAHLAIWVQDLWPESIAATGMLKNGIILKMVGWGVRWIYGFTDTLLVQSRAFIGQVAKCASEKKIVYYPNSVEKPPSDEDCPSRIANDLLELLDSRFCLVFAGNIGQAQSVETIVEAAVHLKADTDCMIVMVGDGSMAEWVREQKEKHRLDNLVLTGWIASESIHCVLSRASGLLVSLRDEEIFSYTVPSKVQAYMAVGKPIVAALNGEGARIVEEAGAGLTCSAADARGLVARVRELYSMPAGRREHLGESGKHYFEKNFEMGRQAQRLVEIMERRINKPGAKE